MKKTIKLTGLTVAALLAVSCFAPLTGARTKGIAVADTATAVADNRIPIDSRKHLILSENNYYGGSLNEELYGKGAPLNGEYDAPESGYWRVNDYYNFTSTDERTVIPHFAPYQQTMADSSGLACALMILNYCGDDVKTYNELKLVQMYEELNNTTVYGNGTTADGLEKVFNELGYTTRIRDYVEKSSDTNDKIADCKAWLKNHLDNGRFVLVRYEDGVDHGWRIIFGMDTMGTDYARSAVLFMANPNDGADHFQDGYTTVPLGRFYRWWFDTLNNGSKTDEFDYLVVAPKQLVEFDRVTETRERVQTVPENHLIRNADGSYGGTTNKDKYGSGTPKNGEIDQLTSPYYSFVDYFNLKNNDTRLILTGYRGFQQTMASSCGICSTFTVLAYYGKDVTKWNEEFLVKKYEELTGKIIYNSGVGGSGLKKLVTEGLGFASSDYKSYASANYVSDEQSMIFPTYQSFTTWVKGNLSKGTPMPVSWRPHSGHWEVIIGYDDMGTDYPYDDVIVLADSGDNWDHYQDGYNTLAATQFYSQWFNGSFTYNQQYNVFDNVMKTN